MVQEFRKGKMSKWLLPVVLVISLFTFSGTNSTAAPKHHKVATEQIDPLRIANRKVASVKFVASTQSGTWLSGDLDSFARVAFAHSLAVKIQVDRCARQCSGFDVLHRLLPQASPSADEDFLTPYLG